MVPASGVRGNQLYRQRRVRFVCCGGIVVGRVWSGDVARDVRPEECNRNSESIVSFDTCCGQGRSKLCVVLATVQGMRQTAHERRGFLENSSLYGCGLLRVGGMFVLTHERRYLPDGTCPMPVSGQYPPIARHSWQIAKFRHAKEART